MQGSINLLFVFNHKVPNELRQSSYENVLFWKTLTKYLYREHFCLISVQCCRNSSVLKVRIKQVRFMTFGVKPCVNHVFCYTFLSSYTDRIACSISSRVYHARADTNERGVLPYSLHLSTIVFHTLPCSFLRFGWLSV